MPPLIAYQLAGLVRWILSGQEPDIGALCLPGTSLRASDIRATERVELVA